MKNKIVICLIITFCIFSKSFAQSETESEIETKTQTESPKGYFSIDSLLSLQGILNKGIGVGVRYEQQIYPHVSATVGFAHITMYTGSDGVWFTTVRFLTDINIYFLSPYMKKLYLSTGGGFDSISYFGDVEKIDGENPSDMLLFYQGNLGWKHSFTRTITLDGFVGYKHIYSGSNTYGGSTESYINSGIQFGLRIQKTFK